MTPVDPHALRPVGPMARWFEDFRVGQTYLTQGRTLNDTDAAVWAMFTGDMHPLHVDEVAASSYGLYGGRFPPGLMGIAVASGLWERLGILHGTGLFVSELTIRYREPMLVGRTIAFRASVAELRPQPEKERGLVVFDHAVVGDGDVVCAEGRLVVGVSTRPAVVVPAYGVWEPEA